jgi:hypothetical protein
MLNGMIVDTDFATDVAVLWILFIIPPRRQLPACQR